MSADPLERCFVLKSPTRSILLPAGWQLLEKQLKGVEIGGEKKHSKQRGKEKEELKSRWSWDAGFVSAEEGGFAESGKLWARLGQGSRVFPPENLGQAQSGFATSQE